MSTCVEYCMFACVLMCSFTCVCGPVLCVCGCALVRTLCVRVLVAAYLCVVSVR